ncbi:hypothetical protein [Microbacterium sp. 77mftsu3.1]|uniref:hypothetical protein n=1 Tax=Microbacterium sp. 77mftsu3.1 TaxID=1761802 RepID=UPI00037DFD83|nr:hypothetical protein [Microbacterium sp. 77mftsu3.1]SDG22670.1 hypothetical protein SAMN04488590_0245 [Microbacterium sp. 77mftsu3.1]
MRRDYPLTSSDLRHIADKVDEVLAFVNPEDGELPDGDWRWGLRVTIWNQDGDIDDVAGELAPHGDGYLGFYPKGIEARP